MHCGYTVTVAALRSSSAEPPRSLRLNQRLEFSADRRKHVRGTEMETCLAPAPSLITNKHHAKARDQQQTSFTSITRNKLEQELRRREGVGGVNVV